MAYKTFYGWRVVAAAFTLAVFGWGLGFYGPPVFLHAVREQHGWPLSLISAAVTVHFLSGAAVVAQTPALYRRYGIPAVTRAGALLLALGVFGWAVAATPWQLFAATIVSGMGWAAMGSAAVNEIVSPWFARGRPAALSMAYNGASIGGVLFSPLWAVAIAWLGFPTAAALIGIIVAVTMWALAGRVFARTPQEMGLAPDGDPPSTPAAIAPARADLSGSLLWRDRRFLTLAAGMALGLFAQIGLIAHLFSLLVPALGEDGAGLLMGAATAAAVGGRLLVGWLMPADADRRLVSGLCYAVQITGSVVLILAAGRNAPLLILGVLLFGSGIGNATSLPPLIAQMEFTPSDVRRVVALIVAISQAAYALAPMAFGLVRDLSTGAAPLVFIAAALIQGLALVVFVAGRRRQRIAALG
ncbi:MAG TPA: MFS transporter [Alphaproteobacteria bacterium]|nr:MFS transporter [Alphaproteobacteria bacterium]